MLQRLIEDHHDQERKQKDMGIELTEIKEELVEMRKEQESRSVPRNVNVMTHLKRKFPDLTSSVSRTQEPEAAGSVSSVSSEDLPDRKEKKLDKPALKLNLNKMSANYMLIQQDPNSSSPVNLSPVSRSPLTMTMVSHSMMNAFDVCDYPEPPKKKNAKGELVDGEIDYIPKPRDKQNPNARGGAIYILAEAPSDRLDNALYYDEAKAKIKSMTLIQMLFKFGILKEENYAINLDRIVLTTQ